MRKIFVDAHIRHMHITNIVKYLKIQNFQFFLRNSDFLNKMLIIHPRGTFTGRGKVKIGKSFKTAKIVNLNTYQHMRTDQCFKNTKCPSGQAHTPLSLASTTSSSSCSSVFWLGGKGGDLPSTKQTISYPQIRKRGTKKGTFKFCCFRRGFAGFEVLLSGFTLASKLKLFTIWINHAL